MKRNTLLWCGILAMIWYVVINIIVPFTDPAYSITSQTISELSAIDAPTRTLWFVLCLLYTLLFLAFGVGVWSSANGDNKLKFTAAVIIFDAVLGVFWPPMHLREVIAAGGGSLTDTLHLAWAFAHLTLMLLMIGFGAATFGKGFRFFSVAIVLVFIIFGTLTTNESSGIESGLPTPNIGIWERINIGAYMLWVIVFALQLMDKNHKKETRKSSLR